MSKKRTNTEHGEGKVQVKAHAYVQMSGSNSSEVIWCG